VRPDSIIREIREEYTVEELAERAKNLTAKLADLETVASEKKAADATFNERKKVLESEIETIYRQYNKGYEMAQIGCDIRYNDPTPGQKSHYRLDTAALVETMEMSWEEKQDEIQFGMLPLGGEPPAPEPTAADLSQTLAGLGEAHATEEVTRICSREGCTLFADHDGDHLIPPPEPPQADAAGAND
jgi:hypothetical protein